MRAPARLLVFAVLIAVITPALAATRFVRTLGGNNTSCNGTVDRTLLQATTPSGCPTTVPSGGCDCAVATIDACDGGTGGQSNLSPLDDDDICSVSNGVYGNLVIGGASNGETLRPTGSGSSGHPITYLCPGGACTIQSANGPTLDLTSRSFITVDGFTFDGGPLGASSIRPCGSGSTGNILRNFNAVDSVTNDNSGSQTRVAVIETSGGTNNLIENGLIKIPYQVSSPAPAYLMIMSGSAETGTTVRNVTLWGYWNGLVLQTTCTNCTIDGLKVGGNKNHVFEIHEENNLLVKNSVVLAGADFREQFQTRGTPTLKLNGMTLLNTLFVGGFRLPSPDHELSMGGTIKSRNNVFVSFDTSTAAQSKEIAGINFGCTSGCNGENGPTPTVTFDSDWNAYVGGLNFGNSSSGLSWNDDRDVPTGNGTKRSASQFAAWQALTDAAPGIIIPALDVNSIILGNKDWRANPGGYCVGGSNPGAACTSGGNCTGGGSCNLVSSGSLYGTTGSLWGGMVECQCDSVNLCPTPSTDTDADGTPDRLQYFWGRSTWLSSWQVGDLVEFNLDGTTRQLISNDANAPGGFCSNDGSRCSSSVPCSGGGSCNFVCERRVRFDPPMSTNPPPLKWWWLSYGGQDPEGDGTRAMIKGNPITAVNRTFIPGATSPLRDAGDPNPANCGHAVLGSACDIGPGEFDGGAPPPPILSIGTPAAVTEGANVVIPLTLTAPASGNIDVTVRFTDGTATGGAPVVASTSGVTLGTTEQAHAITRAHSRKVLTDPTTDYTYAILEKGVCFSGPNVGQACNGESATADCGGTCSGGPTPGASCFSSSTCGGGSCVAAHGCFGQAWEQHSLDGLTWSTPFLIDGTAGAGMTALMPIIDGTGMKILTRSAYPSTTVYPDKYVERAYDIDAVDGDLSLTDTKILHYCGAGSTSSVSSCGASTGTSTIIFYGGQLKDSSGRYYVIGMKGDGGPNSTVVILRSTNPNSIATWGAAGCNASVAGDCNDDWVEPGNSNIFGEGEKGCTLFDLDAGAGNAVGAMCYDKGSDLVPSNGQLVFSVNAAGSDGGWSNWFALTTSGNDCQTSGSTRFPSGSCDGTRLDDRRYSAVIDPATGIIHVVYIADDTGNSAQANIQYFTFGQPHTGLGTKSPDVPIVLGENDGVSLGIDTRTSPAKLHLAYIDNNDTGVPGGFNYVLKLLTKDGAAWPAETAALTLSSTTGIRQYPQIPASIVGDEIIVMDQENAGGGTYNIVARQVDMCPAGVDFRNGNLSTTLFGGQVAGSVSVPSCDDPDDEAATETFNALINSSSCQNLCSFQLGATSTVATLKDNDTVPTVAWEIATSSPSEAVGTINIVARLSNTTGLPVTVPFTLGGSAASPGDYSCGSSPITITAGNLTGSVACTLVDDGVNDPGLTITLTIGSPTNATLGSPGVHTVTIQDNDAACTFSWASDVTQPENTSPMNFTISRTSGTGTASVKFSTVNGTALAGTDFTGITDQLVSFGAGVTSMGSLAVTLADNALVDGARAFTVVMNTPVTCTISDGTATGTITDDDSPPPSDVNWILGAWILGETSTGGSQAFTPRPLGTVSNVVPTTCSTPQAGRSCFTGTVSGCGGASADLPPMDFELRVANPTAGLGTATKTVFAVGGLGSTGFLGSDSVIFNSIFEPLRGSGSQNSARVIELRWLASGGWFNTNTGARDGMERAACRFSTVSKYVADQYGRGSFCGLGTSAGSTQAVYACSIYGLCDGATRIFDHQVEISGPFAGRVDLGCDLGVASAFCAEPVTSCADNTKGYPDVGSTLIDRAVGAATDGTGPCCNALSAGGACRAVADTSYTSDWQQMSHVWDHGLFYFPNVAFDFIFGTSDTTSGAPYGGRLWKDQILVNGQPAGLVSTQDITSAPHDCLPALVGGVPTCANAAIAKIRANCVEHP